MKNSTRYYGVGALLYCPANRESIADSIISEKFGKKYSLALCLEDTIGDCCVARAEDSLLHSLTRIYQARQTHSFFLPQIFIRVRSAEQIRSLLSRLGNTREILSGFILPKFDLENAGQYIQTMILANETGGNRLYMMPIMESPALIDLRSRGDVLYGLKDRLQAAEELVLNIRVGGNDLCHAFGFRRHVKETIHDILPVSGILSDIVTAFGRDYVVSGPVWEYYDGKGWKEGMRRELALDRLMGFVGKTVIHPAQIPLVNEAYAVPKEDYEDAMEILNWDEASPSLVSGNTSRQRMNEQKTHQNWAKKIIYLSEAYGTAQF